jgi:ABC-2 type transport system permease protein
MHRALLKKSLHESQLLLLACFGWIFTFCWARVWIVSRLEQGRFQAILEQLGEVVSTFSPVPLAHLLSFTGRIALVYDEPLIVFTVLAFAIARGSDVVSGEFNRGTLEMLLAQPVSRFQILCSQASVTTVGLLLLCVATWGGTATGIHTMTAKVERQPGIQLPRNLKIPLPFLKAKVEKVPMHTQVNAQHYWPAVMNLFCLGFCFAGVTSFLSSWDRYRWRTVGLAMAFLILQIVINLFGVALKNDWLQGCSLISAYEPQKFVETAFNNPDYAWSFTRPGASATQWAWGAMTFNTILLGFGGFFYSLALYVFSKRDLPAPL